MASLPLPELGFLEPLSNLSEEALSKVGGVPTWHVELPFSKIRDQLLCGRCSEPLAFLIQLWTPLSNADRMVYVFLCRNPICQEAEPVKSFKVFKWQISPLVEPLHFTSSSSLFSSPCQFCYLLPGTIPSNPSPSIMYCSEECRDADSAHDNMTPPECASERVGRSCGTSEIPECCVLTATEVSKSSNGKRRIFPEYEVAMLEGDIQRDLLAEREKKELEEVSKGNINKDTTISTFRSKLYDDVLNSGERYEGSDEIAVDPTFLHFQRVIHAFPRQILRYLRLLDDEGDESGKEIERRNDDRERRDTDINPSPEKLIHLEPLWITNEQIPESTNIAACPDCRQERLAEFQILPTLIALLRHSNPKDDSDKTTNDVECKDEDERLISMDWSNIIVYSCYNEDCFKRNEISEETIHVQFLSKVKNQTTCKAALEEEEDMED